MVIFLFLRKHSLPRDASGWNGGNGAPMVHPEVFKGVQGILRTAFFKGRVNVCGRREESSVV